MNDVLSQYIRIAFLVGKPQDLPPGERQLQLGVALFLITGLLSLSMTLGIGRSLGQVLIDMLCSAGLFYAGLVWRRQTPRFAQAYGALCGAGAVLNLAGLPVFWSRPSSNAESVGGIVVFTEFMFLVWSMAVFAHVLRYTFDVDRIVSVGITFVYLILVLSAISGLMPSPMATPSSIDGPG